MDIGNNSVLLKHASGLKLSFREMFQMKISMDVTIVCDDNRTVQAHKLVLSAASIFFKSLLLSNQEFDSCIFLPGIKLEALQQVLEFIYHGRVNLSEKELRPFSQAALDFKIKGALSKNLEMFHIKESEPDFCNHRPQCILREPKGPPQSKISVIEPEVLFEVKFEMESETESDDSNLQ